MKIENYNVKQNVKWIPLLEILLSCKSKSIAQNKYKTSLCHLTPIAISRINNILQEGNKKSNESEIL